MSYTKTNVIFPWSIYNHIQHYYIHRYTLDTTDDVKKLKYQYYYKNIDNEFVPIVRIDEPIQSPSNYSYITNIATIDIQYSKVIKYNNVDVKDIVTIQDIRELKLNNILH